MESISYEWIVERASCFEKIDARDTYHVSYRSFVEYFSQRQELNLGDLIIGANFTYGWMPTMMTFKSNEFERCVDLLNAVKSGKRLTNQELMILKGLINNSLVGTSKLLHFVNPNKYAIWDSRVCTFLKNRAYKQFIERPEVYQSYIALCDRVVSNKAYIEVHKRFEEKVGYLASFYRSLEQIMYMNWKHPLIQE